MAVLIKSNGQASNVVVISIDDLQEFVGGHFETIGINCNQTLVVNEEGLPLKLPVNHVASELFNRELYGDVVVVSNDLWLEE